MFAIKNRYKKSLALLAALIFILTACRKSNISSIDIYNIVKEAFLSENGYSNEMAKHMSEEVFKKINIYYAYAVNDRGYKRPFKVSFNLSEDSQKVKKDIVYVQMTYSVAIKDSEDRIVGGSWDVPITFTVKKSGNDWYIIDKDEPA